MRKTGALTLVSALVGALMMVGTGAASAHIPTVSASCAGVHLKATSYDPATANTWTATIGGSTTSGTFGAGLDMTIPVPQGGASTAWSATVAAFDGGYSSTESGTVGPCGTVPVPPQPPATVETKDDVSTPNCTTLLVTTTHSSRSIPFVYVAASNTWVAGTPGAWAVTGTDTRHVTVQECDAPPEPAAITQVRDVSNTPDCKNFTTTTDHQSRAGIFVFTAGSTWAWAQTGWTAWVTTSSGTVDATQLECPPPAQPDPIVSATTSTSQECGDEFESTITTTTTTGYVLNEATRVWSLGDPVVVKTTTKAPITVEVCAVGGVSAESGVSADSQVLPDTGGPSWLLALASALLLMCGIGIVWSQQLAPAVSRGLRFTGDAGIGEQTGTANRSIAQFIRAVAPSARRHRITSSHTCSDTHGCDDVVGVSRRASRDTCTEC